MKNLLLSMFLLLALSANAQLRKHPIDVVCDKCLEDAETAGPMVSCWYDARKSWEAEMNRLLKKLPNQKASQLAWIQHRNKMLVKIKAFYMSGAGRNELGGNLPIDYDLDKEGYEMETTRRRVAQLNKLVGGKPFQIPPDGGGFHD